MKNTLSTLAVITALGMTGLTPALAGEGAVTVAAAEKDDPRAGLAAGLFDAETAIWNLEREQHVDTPEGFFDPEAIWRRPRPASEGRPARPFSPILFANTDLAFQGRKVFMGSWHGINVFDRAGNGDLEHVLSIVCPGGQGDVSVHGDLLFMSTEENRARLDCSGSGTQGAVDAGRFRGVRIFDISDYSNPVQVAAVQTCRGSHTHTLVPAAGDENVLYVYNQGTSFVRSGDELEGCLGNPNDPDTSLYSIDVIKVPLDNPAAAAIVNRPRIFADRETGDINGLWKGGAVADGGQASAPTNHCHDITVYPELDLAGGACSGNGIVLDISDRQNPKRIADIADPQMAYWHSATFNNDADKVLFSDEWGGGLSARCREEDPRNWGANIITTLTDDGLVAGSTYKIDTVQTEWENCVSHNGSMIPVPGRDIMAQAFYSGGMTVFDFTDPDNPKEIGFFDQGPVEVGDLVLGGYWSAYWHNGRIYASEIVRGMDIFRLMPSEYLSENEIAAAELVDQGENNPQWQKKFVWPNEAVVALAYLDQLERSGAAPDLVATAREEVDAWKEGKRRKRKLRRLGRDFEAAAANAEGQDAARMMALAEVLKKPA